MLCSINFCCSAMLNKGSQIGRVVPRCNREWEAVCAVVASSLSGGENVWWGCPAYFNWNVKFICEVGGWWAMPNKLQR